MVRPIVLLRNIAPVILMWEKNVAYIKMYIYTAVASGIIIHMKGKGVRGSFLLVGNMKLKMSEHLKVSNSNKKVMSSAEKCLAPSKNTKKLKNALIEVNLVSRAE
ncbi:hypothetical protein NPIL_446381 [Nephila pilipes]|uniref:Uncharacterized protein n=1 Tax=Nephila pilipes TaxID=299642 RepID=A0A8X6Q2J0_NEPPI|nr:hypothetical protein NPIL_446381 [Nephila pilipes]